MSFFDPFAKPQPTFMEAERAANDRRDAELRELGDDDCRICHGRGQVSQHVAGDKYGSTPCPCTGRACYQRPRRNAA